MFYFNALFLKFESYNCNLMLFSIEITMYLCILKVRTIILTKCIERERDIIYIVVNQIVNILFV